MVYMSNGRESVRLSRRRRSVRWKWRKEQMETLRGKALAGGFEGDGWETEGCTQKGREGTAE